MNKQTGFTIYELLIPMVMIIGIIGWSMNIFWLYHAVQAEVWDEAVIRGIVAFVAPLGAVLGYILL